MTDSTVMGVTAPLPRLTPLGAALLAGAMACLGGGVLALAHLVLTHVPGG